MNPAIYQVDAFTAVPFRGNPAGVCILPNAGDPDWMQSVAAEMNLSETAFVHHPLNENPLQIRYFTPAREVPLCGHATLATAHILFSEGLCEGDTISFLAEKGGLSVSRNASGKLAMNFPAYELLETDERPDWINELGETTPVHVVKVNGYGWLLEYRTANEIAGLNPNYERLENPEIGWLVTTSRDEGREQDFVTRFFAPAYGIPEDPVTGIAHCCLGPYWRTRLGKDSMRGKQISARTGVVDVRCLGDDRVELQGEAVTIFRGHMLV